LASIVRRLAELMGGDVDVETAPGEGARFTVHLRLNEARPAVWWLKSKRLNLRLRSRLHQVRRDC
jgi:hypothetical protein